MLNKIQNFSIIIFLIIGFILGLGFSVFAWTNPSQNPPLGGGMIQTDSSGLKIVTTTQITSGNLIVNNGNIGIGTTNPSLAKLQVVGDIYTTAGLGFYVPGEGGARNVFYRGGTDIQILRNYN